MQRLHFYQYLTQLFSLFASLTVVVVVEKIQKILRTDLMVTLAECVYRILVLSI